MGLIDDVLGKNKDPLGEPPKPPKKKGTEIGVINNTTTAKETAKIPVYGCYNELQYAMYEQNNQIIELLHQNLKINSKLLSLFENR